MKREILKQVQHDNMVCQNGRNKIVLGEAKSPLAHFQCHCEDLDVSGDVAISVVICHDMWRLLRHFVPRNDKRKRLQ